MRCKRRAMAWALVGEETPRVCVERLWQSWHSQLLQLGQRDDFLAHRGLLLLPFVADPFVFTLGHTLWDPVLRSRASVSRQNHAKMCPNSSK